MLKEWRLRNSYGHVVAEMGLFVFYKGDFDYYVFNRVNGHAVRQSNRQSY